MNTIHTELRTALRLQPPPNKSGTAKESHAAPLAPSPTASADPVRPEHLTGMWNTVTALITAAGLVLAALIGAGVLWRRRRKGPKLDP